MTRMKNKGMWIVDDVASQTLAKIEGFQALEEGWRFGEGHAAEPSVVLRARKLVKHAEKNGWDSDAFPGANGEILITADRGGQHFEFIVETNGSLTVIEERNGVELSRSEDAGDQAVIPLLQFDGLKCYTSGFYIPTSGRLKRIGSPGLLSKITPKIPEEYQSLIPDVRLNDPAVFATTLPNITCGGTSQRSSGSSTRNIYQHMKLNIHPRSGETSGVTETFSDFPISKLTKPSRLIGSKMAGTITAYAEAEENANL